MCARAAGKARCQIKSFILWLPRLFWGKVSSCSLEWTLHPTTSAHMPRQNPDSRANGTFGGHKEKEKDYPRDSSVEIVLGRQGSHTVPRAMRTEVPLLDWKPLLTFCTAGTKTRIEDTLRSPELQKFLTASTRSHEHNSVKDQMKRRSCERSIQIRSLSIINVVDTATTVQKEKKQPIFIVQLLE